MDRRLVDVCQAGNIEAFYALLEDEPQILDFFNEVPFTRTPLHLAVLARKPEFAIEISTLRPSFITKVDKYGYNPIHLAAETGQVDMVSYLLQKLDPSNELIIMRSIRGKQNRTPLHFAVISGKIEVVKFLIKYYPSCIMDLTARNETAFHLAVKNKQLGGLLVLLQELISLVISDDNNNNQDYQGKIMMNNNGSNNNNEVDLLNCKDDEGNTILHLATMMQHQQMVEALLNICWNPVGENLRVDVNTLNGKNCTALDILMQFPEEKRDASIEKFLRQVGAVEARSIAVI